MFKKLFLLFGFAIAMQTGNVLHCSEILPDEIRLRDLFEVSTATRTQIPMTVWSTSTSWNKPLNILVLAWIQWTRFRNKKQIVIGGKKYHGPHAAFSAPAALLFPSLRECVPHIIPVFNKNIVLNQQAIKESIPALKNGATLVYNDDIGVIDYIFQETDFKKILQDNGLNLNDLKVALHTYETSEAINQLSEVLKNDKSLTEEFKRILARKVYPEHFRPKNCDYNITFYRS